jgi:hypothetical protein
MYCFIVHMRYFQVRLTKNLLDFWLPAMTSSRFCKRDATKRKMEHMPNMTMMGNTLTFKGKGIYRSEGGTIIRKGARI